MTMPFAIFSASDRRFAARPHGASRDKGRFTVRLKRASRNSRRFAAMFEAARRAAQGAGTYEQAALEIKKVLDHAWRGRQGRFLLDWGKSPAYLAMIDQELAEVLIEACSSIGNRTYRPLAILRKPSGNFYVEIGANHRTLLVQVTPARAMTILSYVNAPFTIAESKGWSRGFGWEPAQGGSAFEWQGEAPDYFMECLATFDPRKPIDHLALFTGLFWKRFAPSLADPFLRSQARAVRVLVRADDASIHDDEGTFAKNPRLGRFTDIVTELLRAFGPDFDEEDVPVGPELSFDAGWQRRRKDGRIVRHRPRLQEPEFALTPELTRLLQKLVRWAGLEAACYRELLGVRASSGVRGPASIVFERQILASDGHARLEAAGRAAAALRAIGFKPEEFGI